jgi:thiol:disulfide interchange protein
MGNELSNESPTTSTESTCCIICFVVIVVILIGAICYTNYDCFENFESTVKYNNDTIQNVLGGGKHYKALSPEDDLFEMIHKLSNKSKKSKILVCVLADWCGHCKQLKASGVLRSLAKNHPVIALDDQHPQAATVMHSVESKGFPTLAIVANGTMKPYEGPRDLSNLERAMNS